MESLCLFKWLKSWIRESMKARIKEDLVGNRRESSCAGEGSELLRTHGSSSLAAATLFKSLVSRLEEVNPRKMKHEEKLAFWINVHNSLAMPYWFMEFQQTMSKECLRYLSGCGCGFLQRQNQSLEMPEKDKLFSVQNLQHYLLLAQEAFLILRISAGVGCKFIGYVCTHQIESWRSYNLQKKNTFSLPSQ